MPSLNIRSALQCPLRAQNPQLLVVPSLSKSHPPPEDRTSLLRSQLPSIHPLQASPCIAQSFRIAISTVSVVRWEEWHLASSPVRSTSSRPDCRLKGRSEELQGRHGHQAHCIVEC